MTTNEVPLFLKLGHIIKINSPTNEILHEKIFFINYLDEDLIELKDIKNSNITKININEGKLSDESIYRYNHFRRTYRKRLCKTTRIDSR